MKKETKTEPTTPQPFEGLLRAVSAVEEKLSSTAPKDKPLAGVLYWAELTLDTGRTYKAWSKTRPYLENLKLFIDKEVTGEISGGNIRLNLPQDYMDKFPKEKPITAKPYTQDQYWKDRFAREGETNAAIEQQFYMARACEFFLALGRMTDANTEDTLDQALAYGLEKYKQYGRTYKD